MSKDLTNYLKFVLILLLISCASPAINHISSKNTSGSNTFLSVKSSQPKIISRKDWNAKDPVRQMKPHKIEHITIHHTASLQKNDVTIEQKMKKLQDFSQHQGKLDSGKLKPVWADVPYHYYISADGKIAEGRNINFAGDTNTDYDPTGHALIVLEGNFETETPSDKQIKSLQELINWLSIEWKVPVSEIKTHRDYASTACPGKNLFDLMDNFRVNAKQRIDAKENR